MIPFIHLRHPIPSFELCILSGPGGPISGKVCVKRVIIGPKMVNIWPREFGMRRHARNLRENEAQEEEKYRHKQNGSTI